MRQRIILVAIALVASVLIAEIAVNAQRPSSNGVTQQAQGNSAVTAGQLAAPTATGMPVTIKTATPMTVAKEQPAPTAPPTPGAWVVTARQAVPQGTNLRSEQVATLFQQSPINAPTGGGTISTLGDLSILLGRHGRVITSTLLSGDPITLSEIGLGSGEMASLSNQIPAGGVAVSLQIDGAAALQGIVSVGDDVDVLAAFPASSLIATQGSSIRVRHLTWARVIALGPLVNEVTVMIPNASSEIVIAAEEGGAHFHLVLRSSQSPELLSPIPAVAPSRTSKTRAAHRATAAASTTAKYLDKLPTQQRVTATYPVRIDMPTLRRGTLAEPNR